MNLVLLYVFAPVIALLAFCVFLFALLSILRGDETYTLDAITGLGRQTASESMHQRGRTDHPPKGFAIFQARWGKYLVSGLATDGRIGQIRKALDAEEFVVYRSE